MPARSGHINGAQIFGTKGTLDFGTRIMRGDCHVRTEMRKDVLSLSGHVPKSILDPQGDVPTTILDVKGDVPKSILDPQGDVPRTMLDVVVDVPI